MKGAQHRGLFGRSSGGFGALRLAMDFPGHFGAVACHSGDLGFDLLFRPDLHTFSDKLAKWSGSIDAFLEHVETATKISSGDIHLLMLLGSAGFYSPDLHEAAGVQLPVDLRTAAIRQDIWDKWLSHDPISRLDQHAEGLRKLKYLYVECGQYDQYRLLYGARQFVDKLKHLQVNHHYEEFPDNHSGTDYRYDVSLPAMVGSLISADH